MGDGFNVQSGVIREPGKTDHKTMGEVRPATEKEKPGISNAGMLDELIFERLAASRRSWSEDLAEKVHGYVMEITKESPEWVISCKTEYLRSKLDYLRHLLKGELEYIDDLPEHRKFECGLLSDVEGIRKSIKKLEKRIRMLDKKKYTQSSEYDFDAKINSAREVSLWRYLGLKPKDKVKCIFHDDKRPSLYLYDKHGYCFVCCRRVTSLDWAISEGLGFRQAVEAVSSSWCP